MKYSPAQYASVLRDLTSEALVGKRREVIRRFLGAVAKNGALSQLPEIVREFESISDRMDGIHRVTISTPERLPEGGVARKLSFKANVCALRDVRLKGGVTLEVDDLRINNSIAMRLERIRKVFTK